MPKRKEANVGEGDLEKKGTWSLPARCHGRSQVGTHDPLAQPCGLTLDLLGSTTQSAGEGASISLFICKRVKFIGIKACVVRVPTGIFGRVHESHAFKVMDKVSAGESQGLPEGMLFVYPQIKGDFI